MASKESHRCPTVPRSTLKCWLIRPLLALSLSLFFLLGSFAGEDLEQNPSLSVSYTPCLLWHEGDQGLQPNAGYVCFSGYCLLPDGRFFVLGGTSPPETASYFDPFGFDLATPQDGFDPNLFNPTQPPLYQNPTDPDQNTDGWRWVMDSTGQPQRMAEQRWYPSHVILPDGRVLVVGGTKWTGASSDCNSGADLKFTSTYEVFDMCAWQFTHYNLLTESCDQFDPTKFGPNDQRPHLGGLYPRLHLISYMDGSNVRSRVVYTEPRTPIFVLNPDDLTPQNQNRNDLWQKYTLSGRNARKAGTSVLLPNPHLNPQNAQEQVLNQVLALGGFGGTGANCPAWNTAEILDFSTGLPSRRDADNLNYARGHVNAVILPNGKIFILGGLDQRDSDEDDTSPCPWNYNSVVLPTEMYTPPDLSNPQGPGDFVEMAAMDGGDRDAGCPQSDPPILGHKTKDGTRVYHSTGILLPDGRVLAIGSDAGSPACPQGANCTCDYPSVKNLYPAIYSPPYIFQTRPQITSVSKTQLAYAEVFNINITLPAGRSLRSVALIRPGSVTHSVNFEQRLVRCRFEGSGGSYTVTAPWKAQIAPPGWYMLFVVDDADVPSVATWVRLIGSPDVPYICW